MSKYLSVCMKLHVIVSQFLYNPICCWSFVETTIFFSTTRLGLYSLKSFFRFFQYNIRDIVTYNIYQFYT